MAHLGKLSAVVCGLVLALAAAGYGEDPRYSDPAKLNKLQQDLLKRNMGDLLTEFKNQHPNLKLTPEQLIPVLETQILQTPDPDEQRALWNQLLDLYRKWIADNEKNYKLRIEYRFKFTDDLQKAAEEYINAIQLRGGSPSDYAELNKLAKEWVDFLAGNLKIFAEIDETANKEGAKSEQIDEIDKKTDYLIKQEWDSAWAKFYYALSMSNDPAKAEEVKKLAGEAAAILTKVYDPEDANSSFIGKPQKESGIQYQAKYLYGMCERLLGKWEEADKAFGFVVDSPENDDLSIVLKFKCRVEQVKVDRDRAKTSAELAESEKHATDLLAWIETTKQGKIPIFKVVCLLLQTNVLSKKAEMAQKEKKPAEEIAKLREQAFKPLADFAQLHQDMLGLLNEEVFKLLAGADDPKKLTSFELQAKVAINLSRAGDLEDEAKRKNDPAKAKEALAEYKKVLPFAEELRARNDEIAKSVKTIVLFNLAAAYNSLGKDSPQYLPLAAQTFYELAASNPFDRNAQTSLEMAVTIISELRRNHTASPQDIELFNKAITLLVEKFPKSKFAKDAQFDYASAKFKEAEAMPEDPKKVETVSAKIIAYEEAARMYGQVSESSLNYELSQGMQLESLRQALRLFARIVSPTNLKDLQQRMEKVVSSAMNQHALLQKKADAAKDPKEKQALEEKAAQLLLLAAQTEMTDKCADPKKTQELLQGFEKKYPQAKELIGEALRIRIKALRMLNQTAEASALIDDYIKVDPKGAGQVILGLLAKAQEELKQARKEGKDPKDIQALAKENKDLATKLLALAQSNKDVTPDDMLRYKYTKGAALLDAAENKDEYLEAKKLFEDLAKEHTDVGAKAKDELAKANEELRQLRLNEPGNEPKLKALKDKITKLEDEVSAPVFLLKGVADADFKAGEYEAARKQYGEILPRLPKTDNRYFEVLLNSYKSQLRIADNLAASQPAASQATASQPTSGPAQAGNQKEKLYKEVATNVHQLLNLEGSGMGGYKADFQALLVEAGGAPEVVPGVATSQQVEAARKAEEEEKAKEERETSERHKKMLIAFSIFGTVVIGMGVLSWAVFKRKNRYLKAAHPHLKHPLHHGEELPTEAPIELEGKSKPAGEKPQPKVNGGKPPEKKGS